MSLSKETIQDLKNLMEEKGGKEVTWAEAESAAYNLVGLYDVLLKLHWEEEKWKKRLETEPKGFALTGNGRNCAICKRSTTESTNWYDKWGIKCTTCQRAIRKRQISGSIAKTDENRYSPYELEDRFGLKRADQKKWVKEGLLKARIVYDEKDRPYYYIFLIKDNKDFLPPKKLTESRLVAVKEGDKEWHRLEPWYRFVNPFEHLAGYKIMDYLKFVKKEEVEK
jgi:hypothetical protein